MPQTREHLAILDLLGIESGIIALTKTDLVDDPEWLDLVEQDILDIIQNTRLANAPILRVSAYTGDGIANLITELDNLLENLPQRPDTHHPRLPIDRVFTISGFGTVVTGTLLGGALRVGDEIELQPSGLKGRIRSLQSYKQQVKIAYAGSRVAVNIAGVEKSAVKRGDVLSYVGQITPTLLADVHFNYLDDIDRPLKHNAEVKLFSGTTETLARVRLLNQEQLSAGETGWLQLRLASPTPLMQGDRFILRYPSPPQTIGGGIIVNPHPGRRWKRFQQSVIERLEMLLQGSPAQRVAQASEGTEPIKWVNLQKAVGYSEADLNEAIREAVHEGILIEVLAKQYMATVTITALQNQMTKILTDYHITHPLRLGISREELRSRIGVKNSTLSILLDHQADIIQHNEILKLTDHEIQFSEAQISRIDTLFEQINASPYTPPSYTEASDLVGKDVLHAIIDLDDIVQVQHDIIFLRETYNEMISAVLSIIDETGNIDAKSLRDQFGTSRKYAIGLLEHLDSAGITRRVGDHRVRGHITKI